MNLVLHALVRDGRKEHQIDDDEEKANEEMVSVSWRSRKTGEGKHHQTYLGSQATNGGFARACMQR